jgi:hypothetical protein
VLGAEQGAVAPLRNDELVIAVSQPSFGAWTGQDTPLAAIGMAPAPASADGGVGGNFSAVGVPGLAAGNATQRVSPFAVGRADGLKGALVADVNGYYTFTSGDPLEYRFDTVAGTLTIGGQTSQNAVPSSACAGGFNLWYADPWSGQVELTGSTCTNVPGDPQQSYANQQALISGWADVDPNVLLFVASFGNPIYY